MRKLSLLENIAISIIISIVLTSCHRKGNQTNANYDLPSEFGDYWYQGKAELVNYDLQQVRYGEVRNGHAVLIFVTEDFSKSKQVKLDNPSQNQYDAVKVLKLNATRKFTTGIYPYSTMTSVFTPVYFNENPGTLKLTTSSQEWCGHSFLQANLVGNAYKIQGFSYFESEGDEQYSVAKTLMEDEVWNKIRLHPEMLPTGELSILPGSLYCRLKHVDYKPILATVSMIEKADKRRTYEINYPELERTLKIHFEADFPFKILGWEETYPEGEQLMTTKATLKQSMLLDYWNKNKNNDHQLRDALDLE